MAIITEQTTGLLISLGAPENCPICEPTLSPEGVEYYHRFSVTSEGLLCEGASPPGGVLLWRICEGCSIRDRKVLEWNSRRYDSEILGIHLTES